MHSPETPNSFAPETGTLDPEGSCQGPWTSIAVLKRASPNAKFYKRVVRKRLQSAYWKPRKLPAQHREKQLRDKGGRGGRINYPGRGGSEQRGRRQALERGGPSRLHSW